MSSVSQILQGFAKGCVSVNEYASALDQISRITEARQIVPKPQPSDIVPAFVIKKAQPIKEENSKSSNSVPY